MPAACVCFDSDGGIIMTRSIMRQTWRTHRVPGSLGPSGGVPCSARMRMTKGLQAITDTVGIPGVNASTWNLDMYDASNSRTSDVRRVH